MSKNNIIMEKVTLENKVHPDLKPFLSQMPPMMNTSPETLVAFQEANQAGIKMLEIPVSDALEITEQTILDHEGKDEITVRIYKLKNSTDTRPGLLWIHGGGYIIGMPKMDDLLCERFVKESGCVVVSVDYRLAPQHPYPTPLTDCYAALNWMSNHSSELGIDPKNIAVAGASAGGGLTAALGLYARDHKGPEISFLMPLYPMINHRRDTPSNKIIQDFRVWNAHINSVAWDAYLGDIASSEVPSYASAAIENNYSGLPPVYTCVGDLDPFRDETLDYISNLTKAGVPTEFQLYPGCFHGFDMVAAGADISQTAVNNYVDALKRGVSK